MTNNDDVIVIACKPVRCGVLTTYTDTGQTINLSELAEDVITNTDRGLSWTKHDFEDGVKIFLSKIREAMK